MSTVTYTFEDEIDFTNVESLGSIRARFAAAGWPQSAKALDDVIKPCARFSSERTAQIGIPLGASRLGGRPDVPGGFAWPTYDDFPLGLSHNSIAATFLEASAKPDFPEAGFCFSSTTMLEKTGAEVSARVLVSADIWMSAQS